MSSSPPFLDRPGPELEAWFPLADAVAAAEAARASAVAPQEIPGLGPVAAHHVPAPDPLPTSPWRAGGGWEVVSWLDGPTAADAAEPAQAAIGAGASAIGLTPARAVGDGVEIGQMAALDAALPVDLRTTPVWIDGGAEPQMWSMALLALAVQRGVPIEAVRGGVLGCPLARWAETGRLDGGPDAGWDAVAEAIRQAVDADGALRTATIDAAVASRQGGGAVDQLVWAVAAGHALLAAMDARGLPPDAVAPRITARVEVGLDLFTSIAMIRALRRLWAHLLDACGAEPSPLRVHAFASSSALTQLDLPNNLVRTALIGLAAAVGGADAITLPAFDAPGGAPSAVGRRSATTGQHVLAEEATLAQWEDPAAGAGVVEALTAALVDAAWADATAIARRGGLAREIGVGAWAARMAARQAASVEAAVTLARPRVGVSLHPADVEADAAALVVARAATEAEPAGAMDVEPGATATAHGASAEGAAVSRCPVPPKLSLDEPFLGLRVRMLALAGALGRAPAARVVTVGVGGQARARAEFAAAELAALGFAVVRAGDAELACLCPTDDALAAGLADALAEVSVPVIVAAPPSTGAEDGRVVGWLHRRADRIGLMHAALDAVTARRAAGAEEAG